MGSISSAVPPHLWPRVGLKCLTSQTDSRQLQNQLHGEKDKREDKAGSDTARPPLGTDAASSTSSMLISLPHTRRLTHVVKTHRAPQKRQVGIHLLSRMEGLPSPVNLPAQVATASGPEARLYPECCSQLHKPTDPNTPLSNHDPEAWKPLRVQGLRRQGV